MYVVFFFHLWLWAWSNYCPLLSNAIRPARREPSNAPLLVIAANNPSIAVALPTSCPFAIHRRCCRDIHHRCAINHHRVAPSQLRCPCAVLKPSITIRQAIHCRCPSQFPSPLRHSSPPRCSIAVTSPSRCPQAFHHRHTANNPFITIALPISHPLPSPSPSRHSSPLPVHHRSVADKPSIAVAVAMSITFTPSIAVALLPRHRVAIAPSSSIPSPSYQLSIAIAHHIVHHRCTIHLRRVAPLPSRHCHVVLKPSITVVLPTIHPLSSRCQHAVHRHRHHDVNHRHLSIAFALMTSRPSPSLL